MNGKKMFFSTLNRRFIQKTTTINYRLVISILDNLNRSIHYARPGERFDERILQYIRANPSFSASTVNINHQHNLDEKVKISLDNFFDRKNLEKSLKKVLPASSVKKLPYYILEVGKVQDDNRILGILSLCDFHCSKIPLVNQNLQFKENSLSFSSLKILDAWMLILEHYYLVAKLQCYPVLIQQSSREITENICKSLNVQNTRFSSGIIHLAFVASLGKKKVFESHEVLSQLALYCEENPEVTYKTWNEFETAVMCSSFFRSGIKIQSTAFLQEISSVLCKNLETFLGSSAADTTLDVSIVISLLKVLRQANFVDERVLSCVRKLILDNDKTENIFTGDVTLLSHLISAFSSTPSKKQLTLDPDLVSVLNRAEHFVKDTLMVGESAKTEAKYDSHLQSKLEHKRMTKKTETDFHLKEKIRLKDISRWLWTAAVLGYQDISLEAYDADFSMRFSNGEFYEETPAAVEALLALAIMNHYPHSIVNKVLQSLQFTNCLKVKCTSRQKIRFALFLAMVKIECNDFWRKLSPQQKVNLQQVTPTTFWNETQGWKVEPYRDTKNEKYPSRFCDMINQCMDSLNKAIQSQQTEPNKSGTDLRKMYRSNCSHDKNVTETHLMYQTVSTSTYENEENVVGIYRGCAVPYLFIPGIKIDFLATGKTVYVEVADTESFSVGFLQMKLRIVSRLGHAVIYITSEEIQQCPDLGKFFALNITSLLQPQ